VAPLFALMCMNFARSDLICSHTANGCDTQPVIKSTRLRPAYARGLAEGEEPADWLGIAGVVLVAFPTSFWMLPRMLELTADVWADFGKFVSLPLLAGLLSVELAAHAGAGSCICVGKIYPQARCGRRALSRGPDAAMRLLPFGPADGNGVSIDRGSDNARHCHVRHCVGRVAYSCLQPRREAV
jgi:hypothetical protein